MQGGFSGTVAQEHPSGQVQCPYSFTDELPWLIPQAIFPQHKSGPNNGENVNKLEEERQEQGKQMLLLGKKERSYSTKVMGNLERSQTPESKSKNTPMGFSWKGEFSAQTDTRNKAASKDGKAHYYSVLSAFALGTPPYLRLPAGVR